MAGSEQEEVSVFCYVEPEAEEWACEGCGQLQSGPGVLANDVVVCDSCGVTA